MQKSKLIHTILYLYKKTMNFHNFIILIKSVFNRYKNNYYYNIFLEKALYDLPKIKFLYKI